MLENKPVAVVFMGNSITQGWVDMRPHFFIENSFVNRGISGQTTPQMLLRFRQDVIDLKPKAVVILAGINDIAENTGPISLEDIAANIESMIELSIVHGIHPLVCSVLPANNFPWRPEILPREKVIKLNELLLALSEKHQATYVDYYTSTVDTEGGLKSDLGYDTVHPNDKGYKVLEPII
ncbi:MAG: GDSL-type esterase/lipase family protein, partial [Flavobacteriaceae bacterium]